MKFTKMLVVLILFSLGSTANANEVSKWTELLLQAIRVNKTPPPVAARNLAIIQVGMFDAINSIIPKYNPYLIQVHSTHKLVADVAAAKSARDLMVKMFPANSNIWDEQLELTLLKFSDDDLRSLSVALGAYIAEKVWEVRLGDLKNNNPFDAGSFIEIGMWKPTPPKFDSPLLTGWGKIKTFGLESGNQYRQSGPPKFNSSEYARDFQEVSEFGEKIKNKRTDEQTLIAKFWADGAGTATPPGHWNIIALDILKNKKLSLIESSRLMTLLNISLADAGIAAWDMKYTYNCWRPITAIHEADADENPLTLSDASWEPLLVTPPFPDYVSGHSTFSAAAAKVLELYFGSDKITFTSESEGTPGVVRTYNYFSDAAKEAGKSRIYGGIHYEFANRDGLKTGEKIGEYIYSNYLLKRN